MSNTESPTRSPLVPVLPRFHCHRAYNSLDDRVGMSLQPETSIEPHCTDGSCLARVIII